MDKLGRRLRNAVQVRDLEGVRKALADGASPNTFTVLHGAVYNGDVETLNVLLAAGANVDALDGNGNTAFYLAIRRRKHEVAQRLLNVGSNPNAMNHADDTPLLRLALEGESMVGWVPRLLAAGADPNWGRRRTGETPVHKAALSGWMETLNLLLDAGGNPSQPDVYQQTPAHYAAETGRSKALARLLSAGTNPQALDKNGDTPLHIAAEKGYAACVAVLLQHGAWDVPNKTGHTARSLVAKKDHETQAVFANHERTVLQRTTTDDGFRCDVPLDPSMKGKPPSEALAPSHRRL